MKQEEELLRKLMELVKETGMGRIHWEVQVKTSEYQAPETKQVEQMDGKGWVVDECFVSYHCFHKEKEFLMITYEKIYTYMEQKRSTNLVFLPPLGVRYFDLNRLAPYAVHANQMLVYDIHMLWTGIMNQFKEHSGLVDLQVTDLSKEL